MYIRPPSKYTYLNSSVYVIIVLQSPLFWQPKYHFKNSLPYNCHMWSQLFKSFLPSLLWPQMERITEKAGNRHLLKTFIYPGAGHLIEPPYTPHHRASKFMFPDKQKGMYSLLKKPPCVTPVHNEFITIICIYSVCVWFHSDPALGWTDQTACICTRRFMGENFGLFTPTPLHYSSKGSTLVVWVVLLCEIDDSKITLKMSDTSSLLHRQIREDCIYTVLNHMPNFQKWGSIF